MGNAYYGDSQGWIVTRIVQIFKIFKDVFGDQFEKRIVKLVPGWVADYWGDSLLAKLNTTQYNPYGFKFDALSVAPYFGGGIGGALGDAKLENITTLDEVMDMVRDSLYTEIKPWVQANAAVAKKWNVTLVAYEGGPGLVAPIWMTGPNYANLTQLLIGANSHPMMKDLTKQMFYLWYSNGGELFNYFDDIGGWSIYGSWGMIQSMNDDLSKSAKYQAFKEVLDIQKGIQPTTTGQASSSTSSTSSTSGQSASTAGPASTQSSTTLPANNNSATSLSCVGWISVALALSLLVL